jgi:hypothetical protein
MDQDRGRRHLQTPEDSVQSPPTLQPLYPDPKSHALPSYPPPSYSPSRNASAMALPQLETPTHALPPIQRAGNYGGHESTKLPSISSVTGPRPAPRPYASPPAEPAAASRPQQWPSSNPLTAYYTSSYGHPEEPPLRMDPDASSVSAASAASTERNFDGRSSSVSMDDPAVRTAAEALEELRAGTSGLIEPHESPAYADRSQISRLPPRITVLRCPGPLAPSLSRPSLFWRC